MQWTLYMYTYEVGICLILSFIIKQVYSELMLWYKERNGLKKENSIRKEGRNKSELKWN